jgi:hypothetical protein
MHGQTERERLEELYNELDSIAAIARRVDGLSKRQIRLRLIKYDVHEPDTRTCSVLEAANPDVLGGDEA